MAEAVAHISRALDLLARLPEDAERHRREFKLQLAQAGALAQMRGWASPQMGEAYSRACELLRIVKGIPDLEQISALHGLFMLHQNRAELDAADETVGQLRRITKRRQASAGLALAHRASAQILLFRGEFKRAHAQFDLVLTLYDPAIHEAPIFAGTVNVRVSSLCFTAWIRLFQGHFGDALARSREALDKAQELANPYSLAFALYTNCLFNQVAGDWRTVQERSALLMSRAAEYGYPHLLAAGTIFQGWVAFAGGQTETGITHMHQGLAAKRSGGAEFMVPYYLGLLADAYRQVGRAPDALPLLTDALDRVERTGERWFEAELHRLNAEVLIAVGPPQEALRRSEASLYHALTVARAQSAKLWELRASTSLARLLRDQGRHAEARDLLAPINGWFTEGFDTPDLREATALLDTLP
jgi:predicted ATPase